jgi:hypothetical protein
MRVLTRPEVRRLFAPSARGGQDGGEDGMSDAEPGGGAGPPAAVRPAPEEYGQYFGRYVDLVPHGDVALRLETQLGDTLALVQAAPEAADRAYAPGKWTVKEVLGHLADVERVLSYRALRMARGDATPLPGFDEDAYVAAADFGARPLVEVAAELAAVRAATLALLRGLPAAGWTRRGTANGLETTARGVIWTIAGHELHHRRVLVERYGL